MYIQREGCSGFLCIKKSCIGGFPKSKSMSKLRNSIKCPQLPSVPSVWPCIDTSLCKYGPSLQWPGLITIRLTANLRQTWHWLAEDKARLGLGLRTMNQSMTNVNGDIGGDMEQLFSFLVFQTVTNCKNNFLNVVLLLLFYPTKSTWIGGWLMGHAYIDIIDLKYFRHAVDQITIIKYLESTSTSSI